MPKILANGINFHFLQMGEGPDVVMLHGLSGNLAVWHLELVPLLRSDYRILTYDLRGHGRSDMPPTGYTTRDMAEDLRSIMDGLGVPRAHLVGHSLGADIALHFALLYPDRVDKIVAIEAGIAALAHMRKREDWPGWAYWATMLEKHGGIQVPREKWTDIDYMLRQSLNVPIVFGLARGLPRKDDRILKLVETTTLVKDYEDAGGMTIEALTRVRHPVLLVYGTQSQYLGTCDVLREALPHCTPVLLEGGDHFGPLEQPGELCKHIRAFFQP
jgi:pimeloyl-ACP methyl ester carboxylesterase